MGNVHINKTLRHIHIIMAAMEKKLY